MRPHSTPSPPGPRIERSGPCEPIAHQRRPPSPTCRRGARKTDAAFAAMAQRLSLMPSEQIEAQPLALVVPDRAEHPPAPLFVAELDAVGAALEHGRRVRRRPCLVLAPDMG